MYIWYISKISGKRVIIYLSSKELVQELKNKMINIKDNVLIIKPYVNAKKRVVISNVQPIIPDEIIVDILKKQGINMVSQISDIRASFAKPGRSHVLSLRRQFYIKEEDEKLLPASLQINFDNTTYWTYLTTESTLCFTCKQIGHVAKVCPYSHDTAPSQVSDVFENKSTETNNIPPVDNNITFKRPLSTNSSSASQLEANSMINTPETNISNSKDSAPSDTFVQPIKLRKSEIKKSKRRKLLAEKTEEKKQVQIKTLEDSIHKAAAICQESSKQLPMKADTLLNFLKESYNKDIDLLTSAHKTTTDLSSIITTIDEIHPLVENKAVKIKLTKVRNKLIKTTNTFGVTSASEDESDNSITSYTTDT